MDTEANSGENRARKMRSCSMNITLHSELGGMTILMRFDTFIV